MLKSPESSYEGVIFLNKRLGVTSFSLVSLLRRLLSVRTIGHVGTLDPMAEGVVPLLVGRSHTKRAAFFLHHGKRYLAEISLGSSTDSYDREGVVVQRNSRCPSLEEVQKAISSFQGEILQIPPMFSAKKVKGKPLYKLARQGISIERAPVSLSLTTTLLSYEYPIVVLDISCSKGTYIRSIAHDLGMILGTFAHLSALQRSAVGAISLTDCVDQNWLEQNPADVVFFLSRHTERMQELYPTYLAFGKNPKIPA